MPSFDCRSIQSRNGSDQNGADDPGGDGGRTVFGRRPSPGHRPRERGVAVFALTSQMVCIHHRLGKRLGCLQRRVCGVCMVSLLRLGVRMAHS